MLLIDFDFQKDVIIFKIIRNSKDM